LSESAVLMINDLMSMRHYISLYLWPPGAIGTKCEHCLLVLLHCRPTWGYGPL